MKKSVMRYVQIIKKQYFKLSRFGLRYEIDSVLNRIGLRHGLSSRSILQVQSYYEKSPNASYVTAIETWFHDNMGKSLELESPKTFCEKIQWLKIHDSSPLKTMLADKYLVRNWVKERIGEQKLISLLGVWDDADKIDFDRLPNQFVLKCNHGSGMNIVVRDKSLLDERITRVKLKNWMKLDFAFVSGGFELHYSKIPRKIIAEEYIEETDGNLHDYKIHCFNGTPKYVEVIGDRDHKKHTARERYYTTEWKPTNICDGVYPLYTDFIEKPKTLDEMLTIARRLSEDFYYVRVDLYEVGGDVLFSEMTFTPGSGIYHWKPEDADMYLGNMLRLPVDER